MKDKNKYQKLEDISQDSITDQDDNVLKPHPSTKIVLPVQQTEYINDSQDQASKEEEEIEEIDFINNNNDNEKISLKKKSINPLEEDEEEFNDEQQLDDSKSKFSDFSDNKIISKREFIQPSIKDYQNIKSAKMTFDEDKKDEDIKQIKKENRVTFPDHPELNIDDSSTSSNITSDEENDERVLEQVKDSGIIALKH